MPVYRTQDRQQFSAYILATNQNPYCIKILQTKTIEADEASELWDKACISSEMLNCTGYKCWF